MTDSTSVCNVPSHVLKGLLKAAANEDTRFYLVGVYFDTQAGKLVATDGHTMLVVRCPMEKSVAPFIVPRELIESAIKMGTKRAPLLTVSVQPRPGQSPLVFFNGAKGGVHGMGTDAKYPDWHRVVPATCSGEYAPYDPRLLAAIESGFALINDAGDNSDKRVVHIQMNGDGAAVAVTYDPTAFAVIMPQRPQREGLAQGWIRAALEGVRS